MTDMKEIKTFFILAAFVMLLASCTQATPAAGPTVAPTVVIPVTVIAVTSTFSPSGLPRTEADVPRVSVDDAVAAIQSGEAIVLDVRSAEAYQASHIPGALS